LQAIDPTPIEDQQASQQDVVSSTKNPEISSLVSNIQRFLDERKEGWVEEARAKSPLRAGIDVFSRVSEWCKHVAEVRSKHQMVSVSIKMLTEGIRASVSATSLSVFMRALVAMSHMESSRKVQQENFAKALQGPSSSRSQGVRAMTGDEVAVAFLIRGMTPQTASQTGMVSAQVAYHRAVVSRTFDITPKELRASYEAYALGTIKKNEKRIGY
jgi:hypothetical protein